MSVRSLGWQSVQWINEDNGVYLHVVNRICSCKLSLWSPVLDVCRKTAKVHIIIYLSLSSIWKIFGIRSSHVPIAARTCLLPHNCWYYNWRAPASEHIGHTNLRNCAALGQALGRLLGPDQRSTTLPTGSGPVSTASLASNRHVGRCLTI